MEDKNNGKPAMYCERRKLLPAAFTMVSEACNTIREDYEKAKAE